MLPSAWRTHRDRFLQLEEAPGGGHFVPQKDPDLFVAFPRRHVEHLACSCLYRDRRGLDPILYRRGHALQYSDLPARVLCNPYSMSMNLLQARGERVWSFGGGVTWTVVAPSHGNRDPLVL